MQMNSSAEILTTSKQISGKETETENVDAVGSLASNACTNVHSSTDPIAVETPSNKNEGNRCCRSKCESVPSKVLNGALPVDGGPANEARFVRTALKSGHMTERNLNSSLRSLCSASKNRTRSLPHTNSVPKDLSLCHIPSKSLNSTVSKSLPPPLEKNFSMHLRTSFHSDFNGEIKKHPRYNCIRNQKLSTDISGLSSFTASVLPPIPTKEARKRSFLVGNVCGMGSLLGIEELSRYFPDGKVKIFIGTWNMNCQNSPNNIDDFLLPDSIVHVPDIYAIGVQEGMQDRKEWEVLMQTSLGPSHVLFHSAYLGVLYLAIFLRRDLIWFCSAPEDSSVSTRAGSMVKTKGAIAITFIFFGTSFLFVNSHLTAHEEKLKERFADYRKICNSIDLPKHLPLKLQYESKDLTERFDYVFWCGDLNFRLVQQRSFVEEKLLQMTSYEELTQDDQLHNAMKQGLAFQGFKEARINFGPSYKFNIGTNSFDSIKLRVPSYTDRILYKCRQVESVQCIDYDMVPSIMTSDHKPIYGVFVVSVRPGRDNIPLAAGLFNRDVYLEGAHRRSTALEIKNSHENSAICLVM